MCTSYFIDNTKDDLYMASITRAVSSSGLAHRMREKLGRPITTYGRVKPGDIVPVIAPDNKTGIGKVFPMVWGFTGQTQETSTAGSRRHRRTVIASARSEDAVNSRLFGESWERKRCLVPASWYYEWEHLRPSTDASAAGMNGSQERNVPAGSGKDPADLPKRSSGSTARGNKYMLQPSGQVHLLIAGLYRIETEADGSRFPHFVILTRPAGDGIRFIHDRMPVIIDPLSTEPEFFNNDTGARGCFSTAGSGKKSRHTGRTKEFEDIKSVLYGTGNDFAQAEPVTAACNNMENTSRSFVNDWINPSTGAWRLQEIMGKSVTDLVYEKC